MANETTRPNVPWLFLWGHQKTVVYKTQARDILEPIHTIVEKCEQITPVTFKIVQEQFELSLSHLLPTITDICKRTARGFLYKLHKITPFSNMFVKTRHSNNNWKQSITLTSRIFSHKLYIILVLSKFNRSAFEIVPFAKEGFCPRNLFTFRCKSSATKMLFAYQWQNAFVLHLNKFQAYFKII